MIGLDIKIPNNRGQYLLDLFSNVEILKYNWSIQHEEILCYENNKYIDTKMLFPQIWMNGGDFLKQISSENYYIIFADIQACPLAKEKTTIETYQDFLDSDCELVFLCVDSMFVEVYGKNETILQQIMTNCKQFQFEVKEILLQDAQKRTMIAF